MKKVLLVSALASVFMMCKSPNEKKKVTVQELAPTENVSQEIKTVEKSFLLLFFKFHIYISFSVDL